MELGLDPHIAIEIEENERNGMGMGIGLGLGIFGSFFLPMPKDYGSLCFVII